MVWGDESEEADDCRVFEGDAGEMVRGWRRKEELREGMLESVGAFSNAFAFLGTGVERLGDGEVEMAKRRKKEEVETRWRRICKISTQLLCVMHVEMQAKRRVASYSTCNFEGSTS